MKTKKTNNLISFPPSKQIHNYISINNKQLNILSLICDELTYKVAIEILKYRKFKLTILWLAKLLNANPFDIRRSLSILTHLSLIQNNTDQITVR